MRPECQLKNKRTWLILSLLILAIGIFLLLYSPIIFQEGNPWPQIKGIVQLSFGSAEVVKLDVGENKYITKSDNPEIIESFMEDRGYQFSEQMGSGYLFKAESGASAVATHRYYSRYYSLWSITEKPEQSSFYYPPELSTKYISQVDWPPQVTIDNQPFICNPAGNEVQLGGRTELRTVDNRQYCLTKQSEGAAGSVYTTYSYRFPKGDQTGVVSFTLRFVQCQNYDEPKASDCENEQSAFDADSLADRMAQSLAGVPETK